MDMLGYHLLNPDISTDYRYDSDNIENQQVNIIRKQSDNLFFISVVYVYMMSS